MNKPQQEGETLDDYSKRLILEGFGRVNSDPEDEPAPTFTWPEKFDEKPAELTALLRTMLNANDRELAKEFVAAWFRQATHGNRTALRAMLDRMEGLVCHTEEEE